MNPSEIKHTALYQFCRNAYHERQAWHEHEKVYSNSLREDHDQILRYLDFNTVESEDDISVSFKLKKMDLLMGGWQAQIDHALKKD